MTPAQFVAGVLAALERLASAILTMVGKDTLVVNVQDYGAKGDGATDDTQAIKDAFAAAVAKGRHTQVFFPGTPQNAYRTTDTITALGGTVPWMHAPIVSSVVGKPALVIGAPVATYPVDRSHRATMKLKVRRATMSSWTNEEEVGIRLYNCYYNTIFADEASMFTIGIQCMADGGGWAYNKVHLGIMDDNKIGLDLVSLRVGWVNENSFYGGSFHVSSTTYDGLNGRVARDRMGVRLAYGDGTYLSNNSNVWYHPSFEIYGEVSNLFTGIPIVAEACGHGNAFLNCRNELSEQTVAETRGPAYPLEVTMSYDSSIANPTLSEIGNFTGTTLRRQNTRPADEAKRLVFTSGALHKKACYADGASSVNLPSVAVQTSSTLVDEARFGTGITLGPDYITIPGTRMVGVYVNTRVLKRFTLIADAASAAGRFTVRAHAADGSTITTANAVRSDRSPMTMTAGFGGAWRTGSDSLNKPLHISVPDNCAYAFIGVSGASGSALLKAFSILALDSDSIPAVWLPWEDNDTNFGTTIPTAGTWERGRKIYNSAPTASGPVGWVCVTAGTPGVWKAFGADSAGGGTATPSPQIDVFTANGTWNKPANAKAVRTILIGGGAGGGSGRRGAAGTVRCGGGGGGGGAQTVLDFDAADLPNTVAVTIGAAGVGGASITTDDTNGAPGTSGGVSLFGSFAAALPGVNGGAGLINSGTGGAGGQGSSPGGTGGVASTTGAAPANATSIGGAGGGAGGAGGGITAANVPSNGSYGSVSRATALTAPQGGFVDAAGPVIGISSAAKGTAGSGSGGGASSITTAAQNGGNSTGYGAGGGGGGASVNGNASGAGGNGTPGYVMIISYF